MENEAMKMETLIAICVAPIIVGVLLLFIEYRTGFFHPMNSKRGHSILERLWRACLRLFNWMWKYRRYILLVALLICLEGVLYWLYAEWRLIVLSIAHLALMMFAALLLFAPKRLTMIQRSLKKLSLAQIANDDDLEERYPGLSLGERQFNGVSFVLSTKYFNTYRIRADVDTPTELRLDKPLERVGSVHMLVIAGNGYNRYEGVKIGRIQLIFTDEIPRETELILGQNVREWAPDNVPGELVDSVTEKLSRAAWKEYVSKERRLIDHLEIPVPEHYRRKALERMLIFRDVRPGTPEGMLSFSIFAITLEQSVTVLTLR